MKSTKFIASLLLASSVGFSAEAKKKNHITKEITWGIGARTGYDTNIYSSPTPEESFVIRISPFVTFEKEFAAGPLKIDYRPEYSWYDNKPSSLNNTWNHNLNSSFKWKLAPSVSWNFSDNLSIVEGSNISTVGGVTTGGGDNDHTRNLFKTDLKWEFVESQSLTIGYSNDYVVYKAENNDYRNMLANEVFVGYENALSSTLKLGAKAVFGQSNFFDSSFTIGGVHTTRDTSWQRYLATANITLGMFVLDMEAGAEFREVRDDIVAGVDRHSGSPYADLKLIFMPSDLTNVVLNYTHHTVAGNLANAYWATQDRISLDLNHDFTERLAFKCYYSWENNDYQKENSRDAAVDDANEVWTRTGLNFTYEFRQDLDFVAGVSYDRLVEPLPGTDKYSVVKYDIGVVYEF